MSTGDALSIRPQTPTPFPLAELAARFGLAAGGAHDDVSVTGVSLDSRDVRAGDLYIGMPGAKRHGADFAAQAASLGAHAMVTAESTITDAEGAHVVTAISTLVVRGED